MHRTLRSRIFIYILAVSLFGILLTSISVLWGFEGHFSSYLRENQKKSISLFEEAIKEEYKQTGKLFSDKVASLLHEHAMTENLFYKIYDADGKLITDTTKMIKMMEGMGMQEGLLDFEDFEFFTLELSYNNHNFGRIDVYYPNTFLNEDFSFLKSIKQNIFLVAFITIFLSFLFSLLLSRRLSSGFNKLSKAVQELEGHKWHTRVPVEDLTEEMKILGESFNSLASTLSKEEELRKHFTADLAHELRTPLATLRSQIEAFQDGVWEPTPSRLQQSHDELMRLVRLVNELEKLLEAENPQINLRITNLEAGMIIDYMRELFIPAFSEKGVIITIKKPEGEFWFKGDKDRVIQILTNILNNALKYTPPKKHVMISTIEKDNFIGFSVQDEGGGIKKEDLPYLFERFYRGDKSRDRRTGGIGIGLSIVKALIDAHQGQITIESKVDVGTTVMVFFPK